MYSFLILLWRWNIRNTLINFVDLFNHSSFQINFINTAQQQQQQQ